MTDDAVRDQEREAAFEQMLELCEGGVAAWLFVRCDVVEEGARWQGVWSFDVGYSGCRQETFMSRPGWQRYAALCPVAGARAGFAG